MHERAYYDISTLFSLFLELLEKLRNHCYNEKVTFWVIRNKLGKA